MKRLGTYFFTILIFSSHLTNCTKEEAAKPALESVLVASKWQMNRLFMENPPGSGAIELTHTNFKNCELDDLFEFKSDGSFTSDENGLPCIPVNNSVFFRLGGGFWINRGDTSLHIQSGFLSYSFKVREYNEDWLDLTQLMENYVGEKELYIYRFKAIK